MKRDCERIWEIDALRDGRLLRGDVSANERHRATCAICRERFAADEHLAGLGRSLPFPAADPLSVRRLRARIIRAAAEVPAPVPWRRLLSTLAATTLAALVAAIVFGRPRAAPTAAVAVMHPSAQATSEVTSVTPGPGAVWSRRREGMVERVRLEKGSLTLEVRKQHPTERFLVDLPDGQIEVRGTRFEVSVGDAATRAIRVREGVIAFRREHTDDIILRAGEMWQRDLPVVATAPAVAARGRVAQHDRDAELAASDYEAAMSVYRSHDYNGAAAHFARFVAVHPNAREAEDAAFLEANATAHAGDSRAAATLAESFLGRYPDSFHARDAAVLVARSARDRGDCERARSVLAPWSASHTAEIASALGRCAESP